MCVLLVAMRIQIRLVEEFFCCRFTVPSAAIVLV